MKRMDDRRHYEVAWFATFVARRRKAIIGIGYDSQGAKEKFPDQYERTFGSNRGRARGRANLFARGWRGPLWRHLDLWALVGYTGFLDFGLSRASANALAKMHTAPQAERARVMATTLVINFTLGVFGGCGLYLPPGWLLAHFISAPAELRPEIARALPWIAAMIPATLVSGVCVGALESRERFAAANGLQILSTTIGQVVPAILALTIGPSLVVVVPGIASAGIAGALAAYAFAYRQEGPLRFSDFDRKRATVLLSYGGWVTVSSIIGPILTSADQMLIGAQLGVAAVAHYAIAMTLVLRSQIVPAALARPPVPAYPITTMSRRARWPSAPSWRWPGLRRHLRPRDHIDTNLLQILGRAARFASSRPSPKSFFSGLDKRSCIHFL